MRGCKHGGSTGCEKCREEAHIAALLYSPATFDYMRERIALLEAEIAALREQVRWVPVSERLPPLDTPVIVQSAAWPDQITCAMRYDEGDGWLWGQLSGYNATLNRADSYEFDDDYEYLAWMPLPTPPQEQGDE
jgi:hypothetical protein